MCWSDCCSSTSSCALFPEAGKLPCRSSCDVRGLSGATVCGRVVGCAAGDVASHGSWVQRPWEGNTLENCDLNEDNDDHDDHDGNDNRTTLTTTTMTTTTLGKMWPDGMARFPIAHAITSRHHCWQTLNPPRHGRIKIRSDKLCPQVHHVFGHSKQKNAISNYRKNLSLNCVKSAERQFASLTRWKHSEFSCNGSLPPLNLKRSRNVERNRLTESAIPQCEAQSQPGGPFRSLTPSEVLFRMPTNAPPISPEFFYCPLQTVSDLSDPSLFFSRLVTFAQISTYCLLSVS